MIKHINVKQETHKEVDKVRADEGLKTFDEAIKSLLARPDFTRDELKIIVAMLNDVQDTSDDPTIYPLCRSVSQKAYNALSDIVLDECLDDRCKSGRKAGEELRKKLIEDTGLPEAPCIHSRCLTGKEEKKTDKLLKEYFKRQEEAEKECMDETNKRVVKALVDGVEGEK